MKTRLSARTLRKLGATCDQVDIFEHEWPHGARVTLKNCRRAAELELDLDWLAVRWLPAPALAAYKKATATPRAALEEATPWVVYNKAVTAALAVFDKTRAQAFYAAARLPDEWNGRPETEPQTDDRKRGQAGTGLRA